MTCAFTGPRPQSLPFLHSNGSPAYDSLVKRLQKEINVLCEQGVREYYCGMAIDSDLLCGEIVVCSRARYPDIQLHAAIPFRGQAAGWGSVDVRRYQSLLAQCDTAVCLHEDYQNEYYLERNRYMVDRADILLAVCAPDCIPARLGTGATVRYAQAKGRRIVFIPPILQ